MDMTRFASSDPDYEEILYDVKDWVARITINRPQSYNAYSTNALVELAHAFRRSAFDDKVAVIVFTGAGNRAFCTGGDVKEYAAEYTTRPLLEVHGTVRVLHREHTEYRQASDCAPERNGRRRRKRITPRL